MARRPRATLSTEADRAAHRERQRRYRARLRAERHPESEDVQKAIFQVVRTAIVNVRRGRMAGDQQYQGFIRTFLTGVIRSALDELEQQGFSRRWAKRRVSLALIPSNPGARKTGQSNAS
jgi:hypothetical protein